MIEKVYWADVGAGCIQRANLDGSGVEVLFANTPRPPGTASDMRGPQGVSIDTIGLRMYWIDLDPDQPGLERIRRAYLDGSGIEDIVGGEQFGARDLCIADKKIYWFTKHSNQVRRAALDGTGIEDFISLLPHGDHVGFAYHAGELFISTGDAIIAVSVDARSSRAVVSGLSLVRGIAIDASNGKLYWADGGTDKIQRADIDGGNAEDIVRGTPNPQRVCVEPGVALFWSESGTRYGSSAGIWKWEILSGVTRLVVSGLDIPQGIDVGPSGTGVTTTFPPLTTTTLPATTPPPTTTQPPLTTLPPTTTSTTLPPITTTTIPPTTTLLPLEEWVSECDCKPSSDRCVQQIGLRQVILQVEGNGSVVPGEGAITYPEGDTVRLVASASPGWRFLRWRVSSTGRSVAHSVSNIANSTNPSVLLLVVDDMIVVAEFVERFT